MNVFKKLILPSLALTGLLTGCDNIDEDNRYLDVEVTQSEKVVLIQEFSGQRCLNCPTGATRIHTILEANPGRVVAVAMYPKAMDDLTAPYGKEIVRCDLATDYFNFYGRPASLPCASIDGGSINTSIETWSASVLRVFEEKTPPANIILNCEYDGASRTVTANANVNFSLPCTDDVSLVFLITEDKIIGPQLMPDGSRNMRYEFNHVLRASMNGLWGESIGSGFAAMESVEFSRSLVLNEAWVAENCNVVAILVNTSSKAILQAQEFHLGGDAEE